jgi:DNA-binding beta-propeller fold protein YncE
MSHVLKCVLVLLAFTGVAKAGSFDLYWADAGGTFGGGRVERASLNGSPRETIFFAGAERPRGIDIDPINSKVYWTAVSSDGNTIWRSNLDGSGEETIFEGGIFESTPVGVSVDPVHEKLYWVDSTRDAVRRSNLDGSGLEDLVIIPGDSNLEDIALDLVNGKMYWTDRTAERIQMANLNGSDVVTLFADGFVSAPRGIEIDPIGGKIYFADSEKGGILRANLNGSGLEGLLFADTPWGIDLDLANGKMYFTEAVADGQDSISVANLDGSEYERIITGDFDSPRHLALIPEPTTALLLASVGLGFLVRRKPTQNQGARPCKRLKRGSRA